MLEPEDTNGVMWGLDGTQIGDIQVTRQTVGYLEVSRQIKLSMVYALMFTQQAS